MVAAEPLRWITQFFCKSVTTIRDRVTRLIPVKDGWQVDLSSTNTIQTPKIILAIGGEPKQLDFADMPASVVPLKTALSPTELKRTVQSDDTVAVFGSAQSAKSVLENLISVSAKKIVHFYRSEHSFARHLHDVSLDHVESMTMTPDNLLSQMPNCTKAIYAIGFHRRHIPILGLPDNYGYDIKTGEIAPNLFGIGIAFPEILPHEQGQANYPLTSIWPFMSRLKILMPRWLR
jgi:hypothetical protein